eukprot:m.865931 g.865931  ORF g.865931 m.865931 type:complete len:61 (+) comp23551_c0_seq45:2499-2681(+)
MYEFSGDSYVCKDYVCCKRSSLSCPRSSVFYINIVLVRMLTHSVALYIRNTSMHPTMIHR